MGLFEIMINLPGENDMDELSENIFNDISSDYPELTDNDLAFLIKLILKKADSTRQQGWVSDSEHLNNVRRMAERGLKVANHPPVDNAYIDIFQHILDELQRVGIEPPTGE